MLGKWFGRGDWLVCHYQVYLFIFGASLSVVHCFDHCAVGEVELGCDFKFCRPDLIYGNGYPNPGYLCDQAGKHIVKCV